jgi:ferredoxin
MTETLSWQACVAILTFVQAVICAICGATIGSHKKAGFAGAVLGFLFGPIGVITAFACDERSRCPACKVRIDDEATLCPSCHSAVAWVRNKPAGNEMNESVEFHPVLRSTLIALEKERAEEEERNAEGERRKAEEERHKDEEERAKPPKPRIWFYTIMGEVKGPVSAEDLLQMRKDNIILRDTLVRKGPDGQWALAERVSGLYAR